MIISETFYYKNENNKIFLNNVLNLPNEIKNDKFWIRYIEIEIEKENNNNYLNKTKDKNNSKFEYIVLLSNLTHLKEYISDKEKLKFIIEYFIDKYKFSDEDIEIIKSQLQL